MNFWVLLSYKVSLLIQNGDVPKRLQSAMCVIYHRVELKWVGRSWQEITIP